MKTLLKLVTISLLGLSCAGKVKTELYQLDIKNKYAIEREVVIDNKDCSMSTKYLQTVPLDQRQHGDICFKPEQLNEFYIKYKTEQCK